MRNNRWFWSVGLSLLVGLGCTMGPSGSAKKIPVIVVTDLYHPHQDIGDNFDLITAYALPEIELKAVILDCSEPFRQPVARDIGPGLFPDAAG